MSYDKVAIVGSRFVDDFHIIKNGKYKSIIDMGGIHNIKTFPINQRYTTDYNTAHYLISEKYANACVEWGEIGYANDAAYKIEKEDYEWIHFMYLNTIPNLDISKFKSKYKSCDLSNGPRLDISLDSIIKNANSCDIIFMSNHHNNHDEILDKCKERMIISHGETGSKTYINGEVTITYNHSEEDFMFVTGAGDKFAGFFIEAFCVKGWCAENSIEYAHQEVLDWLRETNEKI